MSTRQFCLVNVWISIAGSMLNLYLFLIEPRWIYAFLGVALILRAAAYSSKVPR